MALVLLAATFLAGIYVAGAKIHLFAPRYEVATFLQVSPSAPSLLGDARPDPAEFAVYKREQAAIITNPYVLNVALRDEKIANLPIIKAQGDGPAQVDWLADQIKATYPGDATLLRISMDGDDVDQMKLIIDAVREAYLKEVVNKESRMRQERFTKLQGVLREKQAMLKPLRDKIAELGGGGEEDSRGARRPTVLDRELDGTYDELVEARKKANELELETALLTAKLKAAQDAPARVNAAEVDERLKSTDEYRDLQMRLKSVREKLAAANAAAAGQESDEVAELRQEIATAQEKLGKLREQIERESAQPAKEARIAELSQQLAEARAAWELRKQHVQRLAQKYEQLEAQAKEADQRATEAVAHRQELAQLAETTSRIAQELERMKLELDSPPRVIPLDRAAPQAERGWIERVADGAGVRGW